MDMPGGSARPHLVFMDGFMTAHEYPLTEPQHDPRQLDNGSVIHADSYYVDEPFGTIAADGTWVHGLTIADGQEADPTQITVVRRSRDQGRSWSDPVAVEQSNSPPFGRAVLLTAPGGRIYIFYTYNTTRMTTVAGDNPPYKDGICWRVDAIGDFVYKFSDDNGQTWSDRHTAIQVRTFEIDRNNPYHGDIRFFWNVGIPFCHDGSAYVPLTKVGAFGEWLYSSSEGVLLRSDNLLTEPDPTRHRWVTLPDGEVGLRAPRGGKIAEEHSAVALSDGSFYCCYRTVEGHPACAYSRDKGHTWSTPEYKRYLDGRLMKHPRAANFVWRLASGRYLYWFHNHGGHFLREGLAANSHYSFENRNPVWLSAGTEIDGPDGKVLLWSQPEIAIYADDFMFRISYPHLFEDGGKVFVAETNKSVARMHELDPVLLQGMFDQENLNTVAVDGMVLKMSDSVGLRGEVAMPRLPDLSCFDHRRPDYRGLNLRRGLSIDLWIEFGELAAGQVILDNRREFGRGIRDPDRGRRRRGNRPARHPDGMPLGLRARFDQGGCAAPCRDHRRRRTAHRQLRHRRTVLRRRRPTAVRLGPFFRRLADGQRRARVEDRSAFRGTNPLPAYLRPLP